LDENLFFHFINVLNNGGFELIYFIHQLIYIIGISKHTSVSSTSDTSLDIIKLEINCDYVIMHFKNLIILHFLYSNLIFHVVHISWHIFKGKKTNKKM
jgi:hypothetical protein